MIEFFEDGAGRLHPLWAMGFFLAGGLLFHLGAWWLGRRARRRWYKQRVEGRLAGSAEDYMRRVQQDEAGVEGRG